MIASIQGTVLAVRLDSAVVAVRGVGLLVQATPTTLAGLRVGSAATLSTTLVVREDSLTLYGFADDDERDVFEVVQTVSGVGPRLALAMLAVHTPDGLRRAVADEDLAALQRVPGIGRKGAQRIVLEPGRPPGCPGRARGSRSGAGSRTFGPPRPGGRGARRPRLAGADGAGRGGLGPRRQHGADRRGGRRRCAPCGAAHAGRCAWLSPRTATRPRRP